MKICYFGTYEEKYPLNRVLIKGLRKNNIEVIECHEAVWEKYQNKTGNFLKIFSMFFLFLRMIFAYAKLGRKFFKECKNIDFYVVGYIGQIDVFVLRFLTFLKRDKAKIIFLPLFSLYDGAVIDRKLFRKKGLPAKLLFFLDKYSMQLADIVFLDTNEHADYVSGLLGVDRKKIGRSLVGADEEIFYPIKNYSASRTNPDFTVLFFGKYIPLHGLEHIIGAAKLLENEKNIRFKMIGNGQLYEEIISLSESFDLQNVEFVSWVEYEKLKEEIKEADAILGIFGGTEKASRVIPNKVFQAIACGKAIITGENSAIAELFTDRENIILCKNKSPESLRDAILSLRDDPFLAGKIASAGYDLFRKRADCYNIGNDFICNIKNEK